MALTHRHAASPLGLKIFVWHSGQTDGILNGAFRFTAGSITRTTLGMISPAYSITTRSPTLMSFRLISSSLCNVARLTVDPETNTGSKYATGVIEPVLPT